MAFVELTRTRDVSPAGRIDYWNAHIASVFPGMAIDGDADIIAEHRSCRLGTITISLLQSQRCGVRRIAKTFSETAHDRGIIHLQRSGFSTTVQRGKHAPLAAGDLTHCVPTEAYSIDISDRNEMLVIDFPLDDHASGDQPATVIGHGRPPVGLLGDFLSSLFRQQWDEEVGADDTDILDMTARRLVSRCLSSRESLPYDDVSDFAKRRILQFIEENLGDSSLRVSTIAAALSMPQRMVRGMFAALGTTTSAYLLDRRLARATQQLRQHARGISLTDLSYELGFADLPHFSRRFKARHGVTPSAYARHHL